MQRYFIYLAYDGTNYHGWQIQPNGNSVQECLMKALTKFLRTDIDVMGAGRTDAGVHATLMVAHFDYPELLDTEAVTMKLNRMLPPDMVVHRVRRVKPEAHARFSAMSRTYKYYIITGRSPFDRHYRWRLFQTPDFELMNQAAQVLFEYTDFTSFSRLGTEVRSNNCRITQAEWVQLDDITWEFTIRADRFLRNMVRAIVGTLVEVGRGSVSIDEFRTIIERKDRCEAGTSAPAQALFLVDVGYPEELFED